MKQISLSERIDNMSDVEAANVLTNLWKNDISPMLLRTHPERYDLESITVLEEQVDSDHIMTRRALRDVTVDGVRKILHDLMFMPKIAATAEAAIIAMMSGTKVEIKSEKLPSRQVAHVSTVESMHQQVLHS